MTSRQTSAIAASAEPWTPVPPVGRWPRRPTQVSIVVPVYREADGIEHFCESVAGVMDATGLEWELIFVEDDSPDATMEKLRILHERRPSQVAALSLSRRFGHQASLAAGFDAAAGDVVICMDGDMQHPPDMLPHLLHRWAQGDQVVYTRRRRTERRGALKSWVSQAFYRAISSISEVRIEDGSADFRLMDRLVVDALRRFGERGLFYRGLVQWAGFRQSSLAYDAPPRFAGNSSYTLRRMVHLAADAIFSFSTLPLRMSLMLGGLALAATFLYAIYVVACWLRGTAGPAGYTSLVLLVSFLGSLNLIGLGIVGAYVGRMHEQVKQRPLYLVKERLQAARPRQSLVA
jgi:dolichol-phosphate mannosyltransferase